MPIPRIRLDAKKQKFVDCLLADPNMNATAAAVEAGYPRKIGLRLMRDPDVQAVLNREIRERKIRNRINSDNVLRKLGDVLELDPISIFDVDENGVYTLKDLRTLPKRVRTCIKKLKVKSREIPGENGGSETNIEIDFMDKDVALSNALKHHGLLAPENRINVNIDKAMIDFDALSNPPTVNGAVERSRVTDTESRESDDI